MKKCILKISLLCFLSGVFIGKSSGQSALGDSSSLQISVAQTVTNFYNSIGQQSRLYNGHEYPPYDPHIKGNALFPYDVQGWEPGEVNYDGIVYKNIPVMYDVCKDVVVVLLYNKFSMFSLLNNKVHDFTFDEHHFVRVEADSISSNSSGITTGFYDQLYGGKIEALAKRAKSIQNSSSATVAPESYFNTTNKYYFRKGNTYYQVSGKNSVLKVLKDKKSELQQYIRKNNIEFINNPEDAMTKIASYYDHLTN
ncbi:MAG: hypothetical protein JWP78_908 [Mucilaginibacter sp.]|nr:hypothetical protein [Mucilaginibacter sp.]